MSEPKRLSAPCPDCARNTNCIVLFSKGKETPDEGTGIYQFDVFSVLECLGCETVFFQKVHKNSENYFPSENEDGSWGNEYFDIKQYWPNTKKFVIRAFSIDDFRRKNADFADLLSTVYQAANDNLSVLAAIGIRTCFDLYALEMDVDDKLPFAKKLEKLKELGVIGETQLEALKVLVDAGNAAAHRGWKPKTKELELLLDILADRISEHYFRSETLEELRKTIPTRGQTGRSDDFAKSAPNIDLKYLPKFGGLKSPKS